MKEKDFIDYNRSASIRPLKGDEYEANKKALKDRKNLNKAVTRDEIEKAVVDGICAFLFNNVPITNIWTGTFDGVSTGVGMVVMHPSGKISVRGKEYFDGKVNGQSGTFELSLVGQCCDEQGHWKGQWVIISGTEGLANLRGQGTWFGPGAGGPFVWGHVDYAGNYHFEP